MKLITVEQFAFFHKETGVNGLALLTVALKLQAITSVSLFRLHLDSFCSLTGQTRDQCAKIDDAALQAHFFARTSSSRDDVMKQF